MDRIELVIEVFNHLDTRWVPQNFRVLELEGAAGKGDDLAGRPDRVEHGARVLARIFPKSGPDA
jgi:hypothetical protein